MSATPRARPHERWRRRAERAVLFARKDIWLLETHGLPRALALLTRTARVLLITVRGFFRDRCLQQAAALTYSTIFSLPSVLAFAFAAAKGFNLYTKLKEGAIEPFLNSTFGERTTGAAPELRQAVDQIFTYVEKSDLSALGGVALAFVLYTALKLLGAVEGSLNDIYGVKRARTLLRRVSDYLAIVVVAPIFLLTAMALTAFLESQSAAVLSSEAVQSAVGGDAALRTLELASRFLPLLAVWFGMTFVYMTLPNTRVHFGSAILGGVVAGTIWQAVQVLHLAGQIHLARYNAIYSSFAAIPMLLLWIYLSWSIFLIGAELAFAHQNEPAFTSMARTGKVDQRFRESIAPRLAGRIVHAFLRGQRAPTAGELAGELGVAPRTVAQVLETLVNANLLARASVGLDDGYLPARDPETITVLDLVLALRRDEGASQVPVRGKLDERVDRILAALDEENARSLSNYTLSELARTVSEGSEPLPTAGDGSPRAAESTG
jgi:membrane protein